MLCVFVSIVFNHSRSVFGRVLVAKRSVQHWVSSFQYSYGGRIASHFLVLFSPLPQKFVLKGMVCSKAQNNVVAGQLLASVTLGAVVMGASVEGL